MWVSKVEITKGKLEQSLWIERFGLPWWLRQWRILLQSMRPGFSPWVGKIPRRREWLPTPILLLENSMDRGAWATVEITKSQTRLSNYHFHFIFQEEKGCVGLLEKNTFTLKLLPCCSSGLESTCQCRRHGLHSWYGKIPHSWYGKIPQTMWQLSPCNYLSTLDPVLCNKRSHHNERSVHHN